MRWLVIACIAGTVLTAVWHSCRSPRPDACELPPRDCTGVECGRLVRLLPLMGPGYFDDSLYWEDSLPSTYLRVELMMLVKYAAARVACDATGWETGNGAALGLGDASDVDGDTPGTLDGRPHHPRATHEQGYDIDIAYYQRGIEDNRIRPVCPTGDGKDAFRCVGRPSTLDAKRTALFIGTLFESERVRVVGVDGEVARPIRIQLERLCRDKTLAAAACRRIRLGYETEPAGRNWYYGHHDHMHVSLRR